MTEANRTMPIVVAGATGDLGRRIVAELVGLGAPVRALVRRGAGAGEAADSAEWVAVDYDNPASLERALVGVGCVVSALSGLEPAILGAQGRLLDAAVAAGVPRFFPSDFAIDFNKLPYGTNRNLDLRKRFRERAERAPIRLTSVLNGAFADMLTGQIPIIRHEIRRVLYWGDADQRMDFTTIADAAAFTARAACDPDTPRILSIAGDRVSARDLARIVTELRGVGYGVLPAGTIGTLKLTIAITRRVAPDSDALYPAWQGMQYLRNMFAGEAVLDTPLDNARYPDMRWTTVAEVLRRDRR